MLVKIKIANVLAASPDELACDSIIKAKTVFENEIVQSAQDCDEKEIRIIEDKVKPLKTSLHGRLKTYDLMVDSLTKQKSEMVLNLHRPALFSCQYKSKESLTIAI